MKLTLTGIITEINKSGFAKIQYGTATKNYMMAKVDGTKRVGDKIVLYFKRSEYIWDVAVE